LPGKFEKIITILMCMFYLHGCGIFDTRTPEVPNNTRSTYVPPTSPEIVIDNLSFSVQEKNSENYLKNISGGQYIYVPDSKSQLNYNEIFINWSRQSEKHYIDNLISQTNATSTSVLFLDNKNFTLINSDSATFNADYIVVFQHRLNFPKSAKGSMKLYLSTDENNLFNITRWEDYRQNDSDYTWSELKANFSF
jgi:hypothetical protein